MVAVRLIVIMLTMRVRVGRRMRMAVVCAGFGSKRRQYVSNVGPQPHQHVFNHGILPDKDALRFELGGQVTVTDVPGESDERAGIRGGDLDEGLW